MKRRTGWLVGLAILLAGGVGVAGPAAPGRAIDMIAPAGAGGGWAPGALDHLAFSMLAKQQGVDATRVRYVPFGDGASAMASILGGILKPIPTARDQGIDFVLLNWRGFYMPPDVPADMVKFWEETIAKMVRSRAWARILDETRWEPFVLMGDRLRKFLEDDLATTQTTLRELGFAR